MCLYVGILVNITSNITDSMIQTYETCFIDNKKGAYPEYVNTSTKLQKEYVFFQYLVQFFIPF